MSRHQLLLLSIILAIVGVRSDKADCSLCPADATGCDISEETTGDTTYIVTTVRCKRGNKNVGEFQNTNRNPYPGAQWQRSYHRSHGSASSYNSEYKRFPIGNAPAEYFDPTYHQRQAELFHQQQQNQLAALQRKTEQDLLNAQAQFQGRRNEQLVSNVNQIGRQSRCDPCPYDAVGCRITEATTTDTNYVMTTITCLDHTNRKMNEVQSTKRNPNPGVYFQRTFYESHGSYQPNSY